MMKSFILLIVSLFLVLQLSTGAHGLRCNVCNSHNDSRCNNADELKTFEEECPNRIIRNVTMSPIMCRKVVQVVDFTWKELKSNTRVIRECGWIDENSLGRCYRIAESGARQIVCSCNDKDLCNSSNMTFPSMLTTIGYVVFLLSLSIYS